MSRPSVVLFSSLFPVQARELFAHTVQTLFGKQMWISSRALFWCSLLQYINALQILMHLFFIPITWTYINSMAWGFWFSGLLSTLLSARAAQAPAFCKHDSCAFLGTWQCPHRQPHWSPVWQRWGRSPAFQGQGDSSAAGSGNWVLICLEFVSSSRDFCHKSQFLAESKGSSTLFSMGLHCLP